LQLYKNKKDPDYSESFCGVSRPDGRPHQKTYSHETIDFIEFPHLFTLVYIGLNRFFFVVTVHETVPDDFMCLQI